MFTWLHGRKKRLGAVAVGIIALAAGAGTAVHAHSLAGSPANYAAQPNAVAACIQAHMADCNPAGEAYLHAHSPWSLPPLAHPVYISRAQAIETAREYAQTATTPEAPADSPIFARAMGRGEYEKLPYSSLNLTANPARKVWVVTVHADTATDGGLISPGMIKPVYSVVIDAESGWITEACRGCAMLTSN